MKSELFLNPVSVEVGLAQSVSFSAVTFSAMAVVCGSGYRSSVSASLLRRLGYRRSYNVLGGMAGWKNAGFETTKAA